MFGRAQKNPGQNLIGYRAAGQGCNSPAEGRPCTRSSPGGREAAKRGGDGPGRGRGPQAPGQAGGLTVWEMEKVKLSRKGSKTYTYWMASWREDGKTRNVHLGSARKMDAEAARRKAREMKAEALGINM